MFSTVIDTFNRVQVTGHARMDSVGYPEIPIISYLVAIPTCDSVIMNIELFDSIKYSNVNIYSAPELIPDTTAEGNIALIEQFAYNCTVYETDAWFPGTVAETIDKGAIRAQDVIRVLFYPIQFNPVKKEIWAYSQAKVTLTFMNASGSIQKNVGIFNEVVGNTLINYNSNGLNASVSCGAGLTDTGFVYRDSLLVGQKIGNKCDYLIVTPDEFFYNEDILNLAIHRSGFNGFDVAIITTSTINGSLLRYIDLNYIEGSYWILEGRIVERIGNTTVYMLPEPVYVIDIYEGGPFRCYYDDSFGPYNPTPTIPCDYTTNINSELSMSLRVFPNPLNDFMTVACSESNCLTVIYGTRGLLR